MTTTIRIITSALLLLLWGWLNFAYQATAPLISGRASLAQLQDSDQGYFVARAGSQFTGHGLPTALLLVLLALVWYAPLRRLIGGKAAKVAALLAATLALGPLAPRVQAYYSEKDDVEFVQIRANQTAFLVTQQGKNKEGQSAFDSAAYLDAAKIPEKRIQIPHQLLPKKGMFTRDVYIPSSVLYVVTRTPYVRQWLKEADRGTSAKNQGFFVETKESINVDFGVSTGAHISNADAAKYLYFFGVSDVVNQGDSPEFPSEVFARELADVMDTVVHQRVQTLLFREFGKRSLAECIAQKAEIMDAVEKEVTAQYAQVGITIEYVGYATQLNFDPAIQAVINKVYIASREAEAAESVMQSIPARSALADVQVKEAAATAISHFDGHLNMPSFLVLSDQLANTFGGMLHTPAPVPTPPVAAQKPAR